VRARIGLGFGVACLVMLMAACSSSGHSLGASAPTTRPASRQAVLTRVLTATNRLRSYKFATTIDYETTDGGGGVTTSGSGVEDVAAKRTELTLTVSNSSARETILFAGTRAFERLTPGPPPIGHDWCWRAPTRNPGADGSPTATLAELATSGGSVNMVGSLIVRGVTTVHYAVTGGSSPPVDIWVDGSDQLRRIHFTRTMPSARQTTTMDLFDFGASVTIDVPANAPACPS
jgi:hypothetical protein